ncbi:hypothetical protein Fmac_017136 [Flemingia macrophylla]|uniref:Reverse transcriptase domain-containing protein n=1 Tax=Flemingia macrophylla TaxID=520843 RepID=A0ABD1M354_9FABA
MEMMQETSQGSSMNIQTFYSINHNLWRDPHELHSILICGSRKQVTKSTISLERRHGKTDLQGLGVKASFIALIPKVEVSTKLGEYRPISLVGSIYKIISKVIATRLSKVIHLVVEDTQSKFMKGRQMLDTVVVAAKVIHDVKSLKKQALIFKAYFKKAYDNINWSYLMYMMRRKGFGDNG